MNIRIIVPDTVSPGGKNDSRSWTVTVGAIPGIIPKKEIIPIVKREGGRLGRG